VLKIQAEGNAYNGYYKNILGRHRNWKVGGMSALVERDVAKRTVLKSLEEGTLSE